MNLRLGLLLAASVFAATPVLAATGVTIQGPSGKQAAVDSSNNLQVNCTTGCSGGGGGGGAVYGPTAGGSPAANPPVLFSGTIDGTTTGTVENAKVDGSHNLFVNCAIGCAGGTTSNASSGVATSSTNTASVAYGYAFNGTTWDQLQADGSKYLKINCATGCAGGTFNNNADGVATSSTNGQSAAWLYGYNGTTWDRLRDDALFGLLVGGEGTAGSPTGGVFSVQGVSGGIPQPVSVANGSDITLGAIANTATCATGNTLIACLRQVDSDIQAGAGATGSAVPSTALFVGGNAVSSEPSKATTGNLTGVDMDLAGKFVTSPYSNRENQARGFATETGTSAGTILAASGSASLKEYITDLECYNSSATTDVVTINDSASTKFINPAGGGNNNHFATPLVVAANTAVTFTAVTGESTEGCSAQGFYGY